MQVISLLAARKTTMTSLLAAQENYYVSDIIISSTGKLLCK